MHESQKVWHPHCFRRRNALAVRKNAIREEDELPVVEFYRYHKPNIMAVLPEAEIGEAIDSEQQRAEFISWVSHPSLMTMAISLSRSGAVLARGALLRALSGV